MMSVVSEFYSEAEGPAVRVLQAGQPTAMRSDLGIPSADIWLSTERGALEDRKRRAAAELEGHARRRGLPAFGRGLIARVNGAPHGRT